MLAAILVIVSTHQLNDIAILLQVLVVNEQLLYSWFVFEFAILDYI